MNKPPFAFNRREFLIRAAAVGGSAALIVKL